MKRRKFIAEISSVSSLFISGCNIFGEDNDKKENDKSSGFPISRKELGETGIVVSRLGFGSHLKTELIADPEYRDKMIKRGFEGGINLFDVYNHSGYNQFKPMGESLSNIRPEVTISLCAVNATNSLQSEIEGALADFHTDYIDLYRLYSVDDTRMNIMVKAKEEGKIRALGVVGHDVFTLNRYLDNYGSILDYVMLIYNFHHNKAMVLGGNHRRKSFSNDYSTLLPRIQELKLGIIGIKPMGSDAMIELASNRGYFEQQDVNIAQAMLRHVFAKPEIETTMTAMNSMEEVETNLQAAYNPGISPEDQSVLDKLSEDAASTESAYLPDKYKWLENWSGLTA